MRSRAWVAGIVLVAVAGLAVVLWRTRATATRPAPGAPGATAPGARPGASPGVAAEARRGALTIRGRVRGPGGPVPGATVTATSSHGGEAPSEPRCQCGSDCGRRLLECGCAEAAAQLLDLVAARRGEVRIAAQAITAADGGFVLEGLADGAYGVWVEAEAGAALVQGVRAGADELVVELDGGVRIAGKVVADDGRPVKRATVTAIPGAHSRFFDAAARDDGGFSLGPLPAGDYTVVASAPGLLPARARVEGGEGGKVRLELAAPRVLAGRVTLHGAPAEGATVSLDGEHRGAKARVGADGAFEFRGLHPGEYQVAAALEQRVATASVEVPRRRDVRDVALALTAGVHVEGVVADDAGAPVEGARVSFDRLAPRRRAGVASVRTDAAGRFLVGPLEPGQLEVSATRDGYLADGEERRRVVAVERTTVHVVLRRASRIEGKVVEADGTPVAGAYVVATPQAGAARDHAERSVMSGDDGGFALDVRGGLYSLEAEHDAHRRVRVSTEAPARGVRVVLQRGAAVEGEVLDEEGRPVGDAEVALAPAADAPERFSERSARADGRGHFRLPGLDGGPVLVVARRGADEGGGLAAARVEVPAEGTARAVLRFEPGLTLSGTVVASDGTPIPDAAVTVLLERRAARQDDPAGRLLAATPAEAVSDAAGRFTVRGLRAGAYVVSAAKEGFAAPDPPRRAAAGETAVRVVLARQGLVRLRVVGDGGAPLPAAVVNGRSSPERDGRFALPAPREPSLVLTLAADGYAPLRRSVEVTRGEDVDLGDVALSRGRELTGVVVDGESGAPVPGARVVVTPGAQPASPLADERSAEVLVSGADGRFAAPHAPDPAQLRVDAEGYAPATVPVAGGPGTLRVPLGRGASIAVRVLRVSGEAMAHVDVAAFNREGMHRSGRTGDDGRWEAQALPPGRYVVFAGADRSNPGLAGTSVEVAGGARVAVELREVATGATLAVTLTGPGAREGEELHAALVRGELPPGAGPGDASGLGVPIEPVEKRPPLTPVFQLLSPGRYTLLVAKPDGGDGFGLLTKAVDVGEAPQQALEVQVPEELPPVRW